MLPRWPPTRSGAFVALFALALAVRLVFLFIALPAARCLVPGFYSQPGQVFDGYHDIALQLVAGRHSLPEGGGATAARAPLYPVFLAALYRGFGTQPGVVLAAHAVLGALTCGLVLLLGWSLYGRTAGWLAGLVLTFHPMHLWWSQYVLSETLLTLLLTLAILGLVGFLRKGGAAAALGSGALVGVAALCNSVILMFPLVVVVAAPLAGRVWRLPPWRHVVLVACATALTVMPWTARNALRFHALIPVNWGYGFQAFKGWANADQLRAHPRDNLGIVDVEADRLAIAALRAHGFVHGSAEEQLRVVQHTMTLRREEDAVWASRTSACAATPEATARKLFLNMRYYWFFSVRRMEGVVALNVVLLALALTGLAATARRDAARWLPAAVAVYLWLAYFLDHRVLALLAPGDAGGGALRGRGGRVVAGTVGATPRRRVAPARHPRTSPPAASNATTISTHVAWHTRAGAD